MQDGKSVHHTRPGAVVQMSESEAAQLGDKVERIAEKRDPTGRRGNADGVQRK
jgi:hypothetical protein